MAAEEQGAMLKGAALPYWRKTVWLWSFGFQEDREGRRTSSGADDGPEGIASGMSLETVLRVRQSTYSSFKDKI